MFGAEPNLQDWVNRHLYSYNTDVIEHICLQMVKRSPVFL